MKKIITILFTAALLVATPSYALFSPLADNKIETSSWELQYIGETEIDGVRVAALLESIVQEVSIPELITSSRSVLPTAAAKTQPHAWRLTLVSVEQPSLRASFALKHDNAFVDGALASVYVSKSPSASGFNFVIRSTDDGRLQVQYNREVGNNDTATGEFKMVPAVQVM